MCSCNFELLDLILSQYFCWLLVIDITFLTFRPLPHFFMWHIASVSCHWILPRVVALYHVHRNLCLQKSRALPEYVDIDFGVYSTIKIYYAIRVRYALCFVCKFSALFSSHLYRGLLRKSMLNRQTFVWWQQQCLSGHTRQLPERYATFSTSGPYSVAINTSAALILGWGWQYFQW